ncbi:hypothetical protein Mapa_007209 [Marchantia paleacea]|nr:hypothetical protein Mapa_007209 [Marchantia paleacea]
MHLSSKLPATLVLCCVTQTICFGCWALTDFSFPLFGRDLEALRHQLYCHAERVNSHWIRIEPLSCAQTIFRTVR